MSADTSTTLPATDQGTAGSALKGFPHVESATAASALQVQTVGWLRSQAEILGHDIEDSYEEVRDHDLVQRAAAKSRHGVPRLLSELAVDRGMAWSDIARLVGVSVSAVRKWRGSGAASAEHRMALAQLAAFLDILQEYAIDDPAQWMEMPLPLPAGYVITPIDLYWRGELAALLEYASQRLGAEQALDRIDSAWREKRSDFESYTASDGAKAIRMRASGR